MSEEKKEMTLMEKISLKEKELVDNLTAHADLKKVGYRMVKKMVYTSEVEKLADLKKQYADNQAARTELKKKRLKIFDELLPMQHAWYKDVINQQQNILKEKETEIAALKKQLETGKKEEILDFTDKGVKRPSNLL